MSSLTLTTRSTPLTQTVGFAVAGAIVLAASAQIRVPMWPVPMTMQTMAVLLIGGAMGVRAGLAAVALYIGAAALGAPVLAGGAALGGPTAGYLIGFAAAVGVLGFAAARGWTRHWAGLLAALVVAHGVIYLCGVAWLTAFWMPNLSAALGAGMLPFLPGDAAKVALALACLLGLRRSLT
jgi:biotin transport system substrate-specific component